jgi:hypothetical protein
VTTRRRTWTALLSVVIVLAAGAWFLWPRATLEDNGAVDRALPTEGDFPGYFANRGVAVVLDPPGGDVDGRVVVTGDALRKQCEHYRGQGDGWACDGLRGLGLVGFADSENVESRVGAYVLSYADAGAAKDAWRTMVDKVRAEQPAFEERTIAGGDQRAAYGAPQGTLAVLRTGPVVTLTISSFDYGYRAPEWEDPIGKWTEAVVRKLTAALG